MKRMILLISLLFVAAVTSAVAQGNQAALAARQWRQQHERAIVDEYFSLLSIPNIARDRENIQRNAEMIVSMMKKRGISPQLVTVPARTRLYSAKSIRLARRGRSSFMRIMTGNLSIPRNGPRRRSLPS